MRKLIAGNWKMNGLADSSRKLVADLRALHGAEQPFDMLVAPPATALSQVIDVLKGSPISVAGQDCHPQASGAHTGDIAAPMLSDLGCSFVIVGHSERRANHDETDSLVADKAKAAIEAGLTAVICIGETENERDAGKALDVCRRQIAGSLPLGAASTNTVIAYEPVWAIGTGRTPTAHDVAEVHTDIRSTLSDMMPDAASVRLLYGGSVKPGNAGDLLTMENVDGALVGGASLNAADFFLIGKNATGDS